MELFIFDMHFTRKAILDVYESCDLTHKYDDHDTLHLIVNATERNKDIFVNREELLVLTTDIHPEKGYIISTVQYQDEDKLMIEINAESLSSMLGWRQIIGTQNFKGKVESVMKSYVNNNAVNPTDKNRVLPNLILEVDSGIDIDADELYTDYDLDKALWEICKKYEVSYEIIIDHINKKYIFRVFKGLDRSSAQNVNPKIIFSKKFDNVNKQSYLDDIGNMRSTAYVTGGDNDSPTTVTVNNDKTGYDRREISVSATDIQPSFTGANGVEYTFTQDQIVNLLNERGLNTIAEYPRVRTFESTISNRSRYKYGIHFFLGDIVTNRNNDIGVITHSRVAQVVEKYSRSGYDIDIQFGTSIPTLIDRIKRKVKN